MSILSFFGLGKKAAPPQPPLDFVSEPARTVRGVFVDGYVPMPDTVRAPDTARVERVFGRDATVPPAWLTEALNSGRVYRQTSRAAWESMIGPGADLDRAIMEALTSTADPGDGMTCQEIEAITGRSHQSVSGNLRHLVEAGLVEPTGAFGVTASGRRAMTWRPTARAMAGRETAVAA